MSYHYPNRKCHGPRCVLSLGTIRLEDVAPSGFGHGMVPARHDRTRTEQHRVLLWKLTVTGPASKSWADSGVSNGRFRAAQRGGLPPFHCRVTSVAEQSETVAHGTDVATPHRLTRRPLDLKDEPSRSFDQKDEQLDRAFYVLDPSIYNARIRL